MAYGVFRVPHRQVDYLLWYLRTLSAGTGSGALSTSSATTDAGATGRIVFSVPHRTRRGWLVGWLAAQQAVKMPLWDTASPAALLLSYEHWFQATAESGGDRPPSGQGRSGPRLVPRLQCHATENLSAVCQRARILMVGRAFDRHQKCYLGVDVDNITLLDVTGISVQCKEKGKRRL